MLHLKNIIENVFYLFLLKYILIIFFFLSQIWSDPPFLPPYPQFHSLSLSLKGKRKKSIKNKNQKLEQTSKNLKKILKQNIRAHKRHGLCFVLTKYFWEYGLPLEYSCYASDTPSEKSDFPFSCGYKWQLASWLGVWFCTHFPFFLLVLLSCLNMWRPWAYSPRLCEITCPPALLCLGETVFWDSSWPLTLTVLWPVVHRDVCALWGRVS